MEVLRKIEIDCANIFLIENDITVIRYKNDYHVELKDVKEVEKTFIELNGDKPIYCLMDSSNRFNNYTVEAQQYLSHKASIVKRRQLQCSAVIINNLPHRLLAQFFSKFYKPSFPMKIFSNENEAIDWIKEIKQSQL